MKAVSDEYEPRSMDALCGEALEILRANDGQALGCGFIGSKLFRDARHRGSAPFARLAGKVMARLKAKGLAEYRMARDRRYGWTVTPAGRRLVVG